MCRRRTESSVTAHADFVAKESKRVRWLSQRFRESSAYATGHVASHVNDFLAELIKGEADCSEVQKTELGLGEHFRRVLGSFLLDQLPHFRRRHNQAVRQFLRQLAA